MLKIRLSRGGKKSQPHFRIIVQEHSAPTQGKFVEVIGHYKPTTENKEVKIDLERAKYWISVGAQPSDSVAVMLKKEGLDGMDKYIAPRDKKRKKKNPTEEDEAPAAESKPEEKVEEKPAEEPKEEKTEEAPKEEEKPEE